MAFTEATVVSNTNPSVALAEFAACRRERLHGRS
jgi:hypothetical protein